MGSHKNNFAKGSKPVQKDASDEPFKNSLATPAHLVDPPGARVSLSPQTVALQRRETLRRFEQLKKKHAGYKAARIVGVSVTTLWTWGKAFEKRGLAGLRPRSALSGRRSPLREIRLTARAVRELEMFHVENTAHHAWRKFATSTACRHCWPG